MENTQPGVLYDVSLGNTITNMKEKQKGFFQKKKIKRDKDFGKPVETSGVSRVETKVKNFIITPNLINVFTDTTGKSLKKIDKMENLTNKNLLRTRIFENYKLKSGGIDSDRYKNTKIYPQA